MSSSPFPALQAPRRQAIARGEQVEAWRPQRSPRRIAAGVSGLFGGFILIVLAYVARQGLQ
jgi:hypothetical protein